MEVNKDFDGCHAKEGGCIAVKYSSIGVPNLDLDLAGAADVPFLVSDGLMPDIGPIHITRPMKSAYPDYVPPPQRLMKEEQERANRQQQQRNTERLQQINIKRHLCCEFSAPPCRRSIRKQRGFS